MSCCGSNRQAWRQFSSAPKAEAKAPTIQNPTLLYYRGDSSLVTKGAVTGLSYLFAGSAEGLLVDERDIPAFLSIGTFSKA